MSTDQVLAAALAEHHLPSDETELCLRLVSRPELIISIAQEHAENMVFGHAVLKYDKLSNTTDPRSILRFHKMPINHSSQHGTHVLDTLWLHFILPMKIVIPHTCLAGKENSNLSIFAAAGKEMVSNQSVELKGKKCYISVTQMLRPGSLVDRNKSESRSLSKFHNEYLIQSKTDSQIK